MSNYLRPGVRLHIIIALLIDRHLSRPLLPPLLDAFLVRDTEQPRPELRVLPQPAEVPRRADECLLHDIQARLLVSHQFAYINVKRQLVAFE